MITKEFCDEWDGVGLNVKDMIEHFMDSESMFLKYLYKFFEVKTNAVPLVAECCCNHNLSPL